MNASKDAILNHLKTANRMGSYFLRPYIRNFVVSNIAGSSPLAARAGMGAPTTPAIDVSISSYDFGWVKFAYTCNTRLLRMNIVKNDSSHGKVTLTQTAGNVQLADTSYLSDFISLSLISGSGALPFIKGSPDWIHANSHYYFRLADESGSATALTAYLSLSGQQVVPVGGWHVQQDWTDYQPLPYSTNRVKVAANSSLSVDIAVGGGDAIIDKMTIDSTGDCTAGIKYGTIDLTPENEPIHSKNINGEPNINGTVPSILAQQMALAYNQIIHVSLTDLSGADNYVELCFSGYLMYR